LILIGSKCDLESSREVSSVEGQELAQKWGCPFFETSAKTEANVQEVFTELVRIVKASKNENVDGAGDNGAGRGCCVLQ
jgi:GTPase KRas